MLQLKAELHLVFVTDSQIRRLNRLHHFRDRPTDVLAFAPPSGWPSPKGRAPLLGEVIVSVDHVKKNARRFGVNSNEELIRYIGHGILHLTGESDQEPRKRKRMFLKQERILRKLQPIPRIFSPIRTSDLK